MATLVLNLNASNASSNTWYDESGNGYNLTLTDITRSQYPIPALNFNGTSSSGTSSSAYTFFGTSGASLEAYFKFTNISGVQGIFTYNGGGNYLNLELRDGSVRWETAAGQQTFSRTPANNTGWVYLVATNDGTTSKIYLNGVLDATSAKTCITSANTIFNVGYYDGGYFNGQLNTIKLYKGALTAAEIAANYAALENQPLGVNPQYEYTADILGSFSGGTLPAGTIVPHPVWTNNEGNRALIQLNAITLGGVNGLNN
jgi:Concanavalin A-like lectin/glucanases superfamily